MHRQKISLPTIHQRHSEQRHRQSLSMVASVKETLERASKQHLSLVRKVVNMLLTDKHHLIALTANQHRVREKNHHMFPAILPLFLSIDNHLSYKTRDCPRIPFLFAHHLSDFKMLHVDLWAANNG